MFLKYLRICRQEQEPSDQAELSVAECGRTWLVLSHLRPDSDPRSEASATTSTLIIAYLCARHDMQVCRCLAESERERVRWECFQQLRLTLLPFPVNKLRTRMKNNKYVNKINMNKKY